MRCWAGWRGAGAAARCLLQALLVLALVLMPVFVLAVSIVRLGQLVQLQRPVLVRWKWEGQDL